MKGVFSLEESLESLNSLESLEIGPILLISTVWGFSRISSSLESLEVDFSEKTPFPKPYP